MTVLKKIYTNGIVIHGLWDMSFHDMEVFVDGPIISVPSGVPDYLLIVNRNAVLWGLPENKAAEKFLIRFETDPIRGHALLVKS